ncbi:MAG: cobalt ECF transporter T component CbiQ [Acidimicrobiia bacterium]|nr:cobalt ECF transporter T component CbiQ [Acidimicrobiia bacterium]
MHRLPAQCKLAAVLLFTSAVVAAPREALWAYGAFAALLVVVARLGSVPLGLLARRLVLEAPFVAFALFLPLLGHGPRIDVLGLSLSVDGLWAAWNILVKGTLGVAASAVLAATTPVPELLAGLDRLRVPRVFTAIAGFMVRYAEVVAAELRRMQVARVSRGGEARSVANWRVVAATAGALFVRCYERGERVHLAMLSRGFTGTMPALAGGGGSARQWLAALSPPALAALVSALAWGMRP